MIYLKGACRKGYIHGGEFTGGESKMATRIEKPKTQRPLKWMIKLNSKVWWRSSDEAFYLSLAFVVSFVSFVVGFLQEMLK